MSGSKVIVLPSAAKLTEPLVTATAAPPAVIAVPSICVTVNVSRSTSVSFIVTSKLTDVFLTVFITSSVATGASFTFAKVTLMTCVCVPP